jgi:predicted DNA-binding transcriptional regulator AlpA
VDESPFVTIEDVCARYQLTRAQVLRLVDRGAFPNALRVDGIRGRLVRFRSADVDAWERTAWQKPGDLDSYARAIRNGVTPQDPRRPRTRG